MWTDTEGSWSLFDIGTFLTDDCHDTDKFQSRGTTPAMSKDNEKSTEERVRILIKLIVVSIEEKEMACGFYIYRTRKGRDDDSSSQHYCAFLVGVFGRARERERERE